MTLLTALSEANTLRPNDADNGIKISQLLQGLEGEVAEMFGVDPPEYTYNASNPTDLELLMPYPYDDIYRWYLCAQIDLANEETDLYANDLEVFNAAWARAQAWYRRNNRVPRQKNWKVM